MPDQIIKGELRPFLRRTTHDYDPSRGFISRYDFEGASQEYMVVY